MADLECFIQVQIGIVNLARVHKDCTADNLGNSETSSLFENIHLVGFELGLIEIWTVISAVG